MASFGLQPVLVLTVAFVIGVAVGWLVRGLRTRGAAPVGDPPASATQRESTAPIHAFPASGAVPSVVAGAPPQDRVIASEPGPAPETDADAQVGGAADEVTVEAPGAPVADSPQEPAADTPDEPAAEATEPHPGGPEPATAVDDTPELLDDLTRIEGVTEDMAAALAAEGLGSFFAVANASESQLRRALRVNRIRSAPGIGTWSAQAGALAAEVMSPGPAEDDGEALEADVGTPDRASDRADEAEPDEPLPDEPVAAEPLLDEPMAEQSQSEEPETTEPEITEPETTEPETTEPEAEGPQLVRSDAADTAPLTLPAEEEPSPLAAAMAALEAPDAADEADTHGGARGRVAAVGSLSVPPHGSAFRTSARPGGPSWTTITPSSEEDLERIIGVTPQIAAALREAKVTNYTQLAAVRDEELRQILADADLEPPRALPTWSVQAALLLQGDADSAATLAGGLLLGPDGS